MIVHARLVVTMDGPPIENGAVVISGEHIVDIGTIAAVRSRNAGQIFDLGEQALLPGLINAHCHLDYTRLRGRIPPPPSFSDWIRAINTAKAKLSPEDYAESIKEGFDEARCFGTTTIANLTAFPELIARIEPLIRTWWFAELIDVRDPERAAEIVDRAVELLDKAGKWGLAPHAPFTASARLYRRSEEVAPALTTHLAESRDEMAMFRDAAGALYDLMKEIGRDMSDCGHGTPLQQFIAGSGGASMSGEWIVAHLNELTENDFALLEKSPKRFHIVHCPRSHQYFGHAPFPFEKLRGLGFNICLGTDSLASNDDLSLFAEMRAFQKNWSNVTSEQILAMVTLNAGRALGAPDNLGRLKRDHFADMLAIPFTGPPKSLFDKIVSHDEAVSWMMIGGKPVEL